MNALIYNSHSGLHRSYSRQTFAQYKQAESKHLAQVSSVTAEGGLLEYETLELRVHPTEIVIDNDADPSATLITVDSANRVGTLVECVQTLTVLGLNFKSARISSDGGWFVDEFYVNEINGDKVTDPKKLKAIREMLSVKTEAAHDQHRNEDYMDEESRLSTVFELAGEDSPGLLAAVTQLLTQNECHVQSAAVWTYNARVAFVLSVVRDGQPLQDSVHLKEYLRTILSKSGGDDRVSVQVAQYTVRGTVHHERRLHHLMLADDLVRWKRLEAASQAAAAARRRTHDSATGAAPDVDGEGSRRVSNDTVTTSGSDLSAHTHARAGMDGASVRGGGTGSGGDATSNCDVPGSGARAGGVPGQGPSPTALMDDPRLYRSPKHSRPEVTVTYASQQSYWLVVVRCKDRNKLLFDSVCTLVDLDYDIFHATIDSVDGLGVQEYYVRPRSGLASFDDGKARQLKFLLEASIQRRFPKGLKVHVRSVDQFGTLYALTNVVHEAGLSVTRAKVKTYPPDECAAPGGGAPGTRSAGHTFYVMDAAGGPPGRQRVEEACAKIGGKLVEGSDEELARSLGTSGHKFSFTFLHRQWEREWGGSPASSSIASAE